MFELQDSCKVQTTGTTSTAVKVRAIKLDETLA